MAVTRFRKERQKGLDQVIDAQKFASLSGCKLVIAYALKVWTAEWQMPRCTQTGHRGLSCHHVAGLGKTLHLIIHE